MHKSTVLQGPAQLWNQRAETRTLGNKVQDIKARLIEQVGIQNLEHVNGRLKNLSPDQVRSQPVEQIVQTLKNTIQLNQVASNHHTLIGMGGDYTNSILQPSTHQRNIGQNYFTAQQPTVRENSPIAPAKEYAGNISSNGQYFPPQGQWMKANEVRIVYNRTPAMTSQLPQADVNNGVRSQQNIGIGDYSPLKPAAPISNSPNVNFSQLSPAQSQPPPLPSIQNNGSQPRRFSNIYESGIQNVPAFTTVHTGHHQGRFSYQPPSHSQQPSALGMTQEYRADSPQFGSATPQQTLVPLSQTPQPIQHQPFQRSQPDVSTIMAGAPSMDEWALLARFKDLKERQRAFDEQKHSKFKQQQFKQLLDSHTDTRLKSTLLRKNMDRMIDMNMLEYDRMMQERHLQGESKRFTESRKRRREMEDIQKGVRSMEEKAKAEIRMKEQEEYSKYNSQQIQLWNLKQKQEREQMMVSRRMVKDELDQQLAQKHSRKEEGVQQDKLYGMAFQMKAAQDEQKHKENLMVSKKYIANDNPVMIRDMLGHQLQERSSKLEEQRKHDQVYAYQARNNDQAALEKVHMDQQKRLEQQHILKEQLQNQMQSKTKRSKEMPMFGGMNEQERRLNKQELDKMFQELNAVGFELPQIVRQRNSGVSYNH
ncbi:hypothetical protein FGO68_gene7961 [Halteria grandinella]|uniref:Uncharacterized protein n=1 Tax=Halteria grandinella TaxID=5974 RepID=A0A8J8NTI8_HALGN|nr:hypothetical protein FGO68_gene7961 [Halteria grandinella]